MFSERLAGLENSPFSPDKEAAVKQTTKEFDQLAISVLTRDELRRRLAKVHKEVLDEQKKKQKAELKTAVAAVADHFARADSKYFVGRLPVSANAKAVAEVINHFKTKARDKTIYVFAGSSGEGAVLHGVYVGTDLSSKGVTAEHWSNAVSEVIGGKAGGREPSRQGQATNPEKLDEAVSRAEEWLLEKMEELKI